MLVIALLKGVPARTTQVAQVGGVLNREAMDLVLNPHDSKAIEAADYVRKRIGGKVIALTMGPDMKLIPLMKPLFQAGVFGVDEEYVLSDRKMAGSDTLATSYAVALGVKKVVQRHADALDALIEAVKKGGYSDTVKEKATQLYHENLLPNRVFTELNAEAPSLVEEFLKGELTSDKIVEALEGEKASLSKFLVVSGIKTTDGETGSVGPQVAEGVTELMETVVPHSTYVDDFDVDPLTMTVTAERKIGYLSQRLEMRLPALLTVSTEYRPRPPQASTQREVRRNNYAGKTLQATKWTADDLGADVKRLGLAGSPTIVGTGIDIGKPPVQKEVGKSLVFAAKTPARLFEGKTYGPFDKGDLATNLPPDFISALRSEGAVEVFGLSDLVAELF